MAGEDMYQAHVLDHYRNPRNFGALDPADAEATASNPLCGDEVRLTLRVEGEALADVRFEGRGCAICLAAASLLTERVKARPLAEARALGRDDVVAMLGIPVSPVRLKCALLAHGALREAVDAFDQSGGGSESQRKGGVGRS